MLMVRETNIAVGTQNGASPRIHKTQHRGWISFQDADRLPKLEDSVEDLLQQLAQLLRCQLDTVGCGTRSSVLLVHDPGDIHA